MIVTKKVDAQQFVYGHAFCINRTACRLLVKRAIAVLPKVSTQKVLAAEACLVDIYYHHTSVYTMCANSCIIFKGGL